MHSSIFAASRPPATRRSALAFPASLNQIISIRCASSASTHDRNAGVNSTAVLFPFPKHPHPTPYEIFHLQPGARPNEIKSRYYQLVRIHHPDAPHARKLPSHVSHAHFQAIQAAHDVLTGKARRAHNPFSMHASSSAGNKEYVHRRAHRSHNGNAEWARAAEEAEEHADDRQKDQIIVLGAIAAIGLAVVPFLTSTTVSTDKHMTAVQNLAEARREAQEHGLVRRREIRKRVRENELNREYEGRAIPDKEPPSRGGAVVES